MRIFRKLAVSSSIAVGLPILLGGIVRATGSGDACPDWPKCFGRWLPPANYHAILEYSHRLAAAIAGIFLLGLALALLANAQARTRPSLTVPAGVAFALLIFQSYLGKLVVERALSPALVTVHLGTALLLQATVTVAAVNAFYVPEIFFSAASTPSHGTEDDIGLAQHAAQRASNGRSDKRNPIRPTRRYPAGLAILAAASVFAVILVGAYMRAEGAQLAFSDWPLMAGRIFPSLDTEARRIHFAHRIAALAAAVPVVWLAVRTTSLRPRIGKMVAFAHLAAGAYILQSLAGAAIVLTDLSQWSRAVHVALASLAFVSSIATAAISVNEARIVPLEESSDAQVQSA
ncbi:MAG: hypothetical protein C4318_04645 [Acidimicrobiia bacterium]